MNKALLLGIGAVILFILTFYVFTIDIRGIWATTVFSLASVIVGIIQIWKRKGRLVYNIVAIAIGVLLIGFYIWLDIALSNLFN